MHIEKKALHIIILIIIGLYSCTHNSPQNPTSRKIVQSFKIHDDNVNGANLRIQNVTLRENTDYYYKYDGLLDSLSVHSDTSTSATLIRTMKLKYMPDRVRAYLYDTAGSFSLDLYYNSQKQLVKMIDTFGIGYGFFFNYNSNKLTNLRIVSDSTSYFTNFVYDGYDNLLQYIITDFQSQPLMRVDFEYDLTKKTPRNLDMRFASGGVRFLYAGGVNVLSLMDLNYGAGNTHSITKRTEYNLQTAQNSNTYLYNYTINNNQEITNRKITLNDTINVFYEYRY